MALITRTYTFVDGTTAYGSQVESEIATIVNKLNLLNAGTDAWDVISVATMTLTNDLTISTAAKGIVLKTPDGTHTYRIAISNNGEITSEQVS